MYDLTLNTPALLFPTISLLLLAYTNRYIAISNRIRALHSQYKTEQSNVIILQIKSCAQITAAPCISALIRLISNHI